MGLLWFRVTIFKKFTGMSDFTFRHFRNIVVSANRELQLQKEKEELIAKNEEERRKLFKEIEELRKNK